ncbi:MAG: ROK family protein [Niabella sp.]
MQQIAIGIDLGGTRIKATAISNCGQILHRAYLPTNDNKEGAWKQVVANAIIKIRQKINNHKAVVGISAPGLPCNDNACIAHMPGRMHGIEQFHWGNYLQCEAYVLNDAVAALLGELNYGVAKNRKHVVMLTLGTGVGGAILIDGKPYLGAFNKAGHAGHMVINCNGENDITGMPGSLEDCIGNYTILRRSNGKFSSTDQLLQALEKGDEEAEKIWLTSVNHLALGIASITNIVSPELVVVGGGISKANQKLFVPLKKYISKYEWRAGSAGVEIKKAALGDMAGAIGAAVFAIQKTKQYE